VTERLSAGGYDVAAAKRKGVRQGDAGPGPGGGRARAGVRDAVEEDRALLEADGRRRSPPLPPYTRHEQPADGQFRLLFGRSPVHTFGRTTNNRFLSEVYDENEVWLNAKAAKEQGLANGEVVTLVNQDGVRSQPVKLKVTQRIRPDCVFVVHGYGHTNPGLRFAANRGMDDQTLVTRIAVDPVAGTTGMSVNFVTIEKSGKDGDGERREGGGLRWAPRSPPRSATR
jgi:Anaerobic dehydrogenases, typically selenocysteine-containing